MRRFPHLLAVFLIALSACTQDTSEVSAPTRISDIGTMESVSIKVPIKSGRQKYINAKIIKANPYEGTSLYAVSVEFDVTTNDNKRAQRQLAPSNAGTVQIFANTYGPNMSPNTVMQLGQQVASQTVCQGRKITVNASNRRYTGVSRPVTESSIPGIEWNGKTWTANLFCE